MIVHLIDGTYELYRHFYGLRRFTKGEDPPFGAVIGVLNTVLQMLESGTTHVGVATDHVIESFRNDLWPGYKTGAVTAARLLNKHGPIDDFPPEILGDNRALAILFKDLATLRTNAPLFRDVEELRWRGPSDAVAAFAERSGHARLIARCAAVIIA